VSGARRLRFALVASATLLLPLAGRAAARGGSTRVKLPPELRYVYEDDDQAAAEMLPALLKKHGTPRGAAALVKLLRGKRSYPSRVPDRETLDFACSDGKTRQFTCLAPKKYSRSRPVGVLIFLHGAVRQPPPGGGANEAGMFAPAVRDLNLLVVGPSTYEGVEWGSEACRGLVHHALDHVKLHYNVDENRVYLAGDSDGGRGTYAIAETEGTFLAACVPVIGAPGGVTRFANLRNLPWFAINGDKDSIFDIGRVREAVEAMKRSGIGIEFKVVEGQGHDPRYFLTYKDEICEFLKSHPRDPYPKQVFLQWEPKEGYESGFPANTFRWARIEKTGAADSDGSFDDPPGSLLGRGLPRLEARRDGNRIDVTTRDVQRYSVLVSDEMLDLGKEIEVFTNGALSFRGQLEPDAQVVLEEARRYRDRTLVFAGRITVDVGSE